MLPPTNVNAAKQESIVIELKAFVLRPAPERIVSTENFEQASVALFARVIALRFANKQKLESLQ